MDLETAIEELEKFQEQEITVRRIINSMNKILKTRISRKEKRKIQFQQEIFRSRHNSIYPFTDFLSNYAKTDIPQPIDYGRRAKKWYDEVNEIKHTNDFIEDKILSIKPSFISVMLNYIYHQFIPHKTKYLVDNSLSRFKKRDLFLYQLDLSSYIELENNLKDVNIREYRRQLFSYSLDLIYISNSKEELEIDIEREEILDSVVCIHLFQKNLEHIYNAIMYSKEEINPRLKENLDYEKQLILPKIFDLENKKIVELTKLL
ncbi:hypothetical protein KY321_01855 [Candidatus Woesearchaeota archaeon]|nr:hypothetical protein [Candidatus Woesearchaeota archaeon]